MRILKRVEVEIRIKVGACVEIQKLADRELYNKSLLSLAKTTSILVTILLIIEIGFV